MVRSSEVTEVLYSLPQVRDYLHAFYDCSYAQFFRTLGASLSSLLLLGNVYSDIPLVSS